MWKVMSLWRIYWEQVGLISFVRRAIFQISTYCFIKLLFIAFKCISLTLVLKFHLNVVWGGWGRWWWGSWGCWEHDKKRMWMWSSWSSLKYHHIQVSLPGAATLASDLYSAVVHRSDLGDNELPEARITGNPEVNLGTKERKTALKLSSLN